MLTYHQGNIKVAVNNVYLVHSYLNVNARQHRLQQTMLSRFVKTGNELNVALKTGKTSIITASDGKLKLSKVKNNATSNAPTS